jgi:Xaa-Pro aminopeptidase
MKNENLLIVADSERNADLRYAVGFATPCSFVYLRLREQSLAVLPDVALARARKLARNCRIVSLSAYQRRIGSTGATVTGLAPIIRSILHEKDLKKVVVPAAFPLALARDLRRLKVKLRIKEDPFFPGRQLKSTVEVKKISAALTMAEVGLAEGLLALRSAKPARDRSLVYRNAPLTSERLRAIIDTAILHAGGYPCQTLVASGRQACDPQEQGHGRLRANEPTVISALVRSSKTGYHAGITRTAVKGRASDPVRKMHDTVRRAQDLAFAQLKARTTALSLHQSVHRFFELEGYSSRSRNGSTEGFFHGTGHGLGLESHEAPYLGPGSADRLSVGHVISLGPGLAYPHLGVVRLEDVVQIATQGPRNLTKFEKTLEL